MQVAWAKREEPANDPLQISLLRSLCNSAVDRDVPHSGPSQGAGRGAEDAVRRSLLLCVHGSSWGNSCSPGKISRGFTAAVGSIWMGPIYDSEGGGGSKIGRKMSVLPVLRNKLHLRQIKKQSQFNRDVQTGGAVFTLSRFKLMFITSQDEPRLSFQNDSKFCTALPECSASAGIAWVAWDCWEGRIFLHFLYFLFVSCHVSWSLIFVHLDLQEMLQIFCFTLKNRSHLSNLRAAAKVIIQKL